MRSVAVGEKYLSGKLAKPLADRRQYYTSVLAPPDIHNMRSKYNVKVTGAGESHVIGDILSWVVATAVFFGFWVLLMRRFGNQQVQAALDGDPDRIAAMAPGWSLDWSAAAGCSSRRSGRSSPSIELPPLDAR